MAYIIGVSEGIDLVVHLVGFSTPIGAQVFPRRGVSVRSPTCLHNYYVVRMVLRNGRSLCYSFDRDDDVVIIEFKRREVFDSKAIVRRESRVGVS